MNTEAYAVNCYVYETILGNITLCENGTAITSLYFGSPGAENKAETPLLRLAYEQLNEYLCGARKSFDVPLSPEGTDFQRRIWRALAEVPYAETVSYSSLARTVGSPKACRAVANACGANPIPLFIPCHRVIRSDGSPGGYSCGIEYKVKLLELESENRYEK